MKFKNSNLVGQDNQTVLLGTGSDVEVFFDGSDFLVRTVTGSKNMIKATPDGDLSLYQDGALVLRLYDITGGGIYGIELNGQSGHKGVWFFVSDNMALANQELGGLSQINATQAGGSTVNLLSGDPDGGTSLFFNDFKTIETLATGIILGDGTRTSTETITGGDTAQLKITGNDLDIQVDQATGKINLKDNSGTTILAISSTGMALTAGATVNEIETSLTNDDTHIPTSGAVFDAIAGVPTHTRLHSMTDILDHSANNWKLFYSNGSGQVIELSLGAVNTVVQGNGVGAAPTMAQLNHSQIGSIGASDHHGDNLIAQLNSNVTVTDAGTGQVDVVVDTENEMNITSSGVQLATGARVDNIETSVTDDDTHLPTSGAIVDYVPTVSINAVSEDTSPTLGGDLTLDENSIKFVPGSLANQTAEGEIATMTIDAAAAVSFGDVLYMASDFELELADADASATMPAIAMSLGTAEGSVDVLLRGFVRDDLWNWSAGPIYVDTIAGTLTQTAPSGTGDRVQRVGWAYSADIMFFDPDSTDIGVA